MPTIQLKKRQDQMLRGKRQEIVTHNKETNKSIEADLEMTERTNSCYNYV